MIAAEEELIKKRLLIEGDSGNDDRLINKLTKYFVKWTNSFFAGNESNEEETTSYLNEQIVAALAHTELTLVRNQFILDMNRSEQENYEVLYKKIDDEIEKAKLKIVEKKSELQDARKIRKNRQEYNVIARQILDYPDRLEMQSTIKTLENKVESLKKAEAECDKKIELRRKQFGVVLESLSSLKNLIESDTNLEQYLSSQAEDEESSQVVAMDEKTASTAQVDSEEKKDIEEDAEDENNLDLDVEKSEKHQTIAPVTAPVEVEMEEVID